MDVPPPNIPRVMQDGELELQEGQMVPVLVQPGSHRLIILNSLALARIQVGQATLLHIDDLGTQTILIQEIDRLALIVRYSEH